MGSVGAESTNFACDMVSFFNLKTLARLTERAYAALFGQLHAFFALFLYFFAPKMSFFTLVSFQAIV